MILSEANRSLDHAHMFLESSSRSKLSPSNRFAGEEPCLRQLSAHQHSDNRLPTPKDDPRKTHTACPMYAKPKTKPKNGTDCDMPAVGALSSVYAVAATFRFTLGEIICCIQAYVSEATLDPAEVPYKARPRVLRIPFACQRPRRPFH